MKNKRCVNIVNRKIILLLFLFCMQPSTALLASGDNLVANLKFKRFPALNNLPSDEIQKIYQDKDDLFGWQVVMASINMTVMKLLCINQTCILPDC